MHTSKEQISALIQKLSNLPTFGEGNLPPPPPLNDGEEGGRFDPMEPRVARLEAHMEHVRAELAKLASVPVDLATLNERVSHLPTKGWMVGVTLTAFAFVTGLITFSEKLQALVR